MSEEQEQTGPSKELMRYYKRTYGDKAEEMYEKNQKRKQEIKKNKTTPAPPKEKKRESPEVRRQKNKAFSRLSYYRRTYGKDKAEQLMKLNELKKQLCVTNP